MKTLVTVSLVMIVAFLYGLDRGSFVSEKEDVRRLAVERIRSAPVDYEKVMVAAEKRVRVLHEEFSSGGEVNSSALEEDLRRLRGACQKMQRTATLGKVPAEDPEARALVEKKWVRYQSETRLLRDQVLEKTATPREVKGGERPGGEGPPSESRVYWETIGAFIELRERTILDLLYNTPPGERGLNEALLRDEVALLKACEITPKKTRGVSVRVVVPQEHSLKADPDVQTFYRSLDLVPDAQPIRSGGFLVPVGARTVTLRENKAKMVFRPRRGKGVAYLGQSETEIQYGYVAVPPDTAYYFENIGSEPLELEYVGLKP